MIRVRDLLFTYRGDEFRLQVGELVVSEGETLAIIGASGSGKTTLIHLLAGILTPAAGQIELSGLDLAGLGFEDRQDVRAVKMGLVFQEFELLEYLPVIDNILLPYRLTPLLELDEKVRRRGVLLAEEVGLDGKLLRYPGELSQGERQRVAVCRALVSRPSLLLGDEPTGNLDPANRDQVMDTLFRYSNETGAPLVVVTHDHELVPRFDRAIDVTELA